LGNPVCNAALYDMSPVNGGKIPEEFSGAFGLVCYRNASGVISCFAKRMQQDKWLENMVREAKKIVKE
jgi:hypothetical protein